MRSEREPAWIRLARAQHGVISIRQLTACRVSPDRVASLTTRSILIRQDNGIYRVAAAPASFDASLWAAVLATQGVLAASSAAYLWGLIEQHTGPIQIIVPTARRIRTPVGVRLRRLDLPAAVVGSRYRLPVTSRAISALDHLVGLPRTEAVAFADRALQRGWLKHADLIRRLDQPRRGNVLLRKVVSTLVHGAEAESERLLHRLLRANGVVGWLPNYQLRVGGAVRARIDLAFPAERIAIEVDGFAYHSDRARFQRDRTRQNELMLLGWTVLRFTWNDLNDRPDYVLQTILLALHAAGA